MGLFGDIKGQSSARGGVYFTPGNYVVEVERCKIGQTRKGVDFFVAECKVIETDSKELRPGASASFLVTLDKDPALGNIADFMRMGLWLQGRDAGIDGLPADADSVSLEEGDADEICGEDNPFVGLRVGLEAYNKPTKAGNDFTRMKWLLPETAAANIEMARAAGA